MLLHSVIKDVLFISFSDTFIEEIITQLTFTCSKSTIETLEKGVKYVQSLTGATRSDFLVRVSN